MGRFTHSPLPSPSPSPSASTPPLTPIERAAYDIMTSERLKGETKTFYKKYFKAFYESIQSWFDITMTFITNNNYKMLKGLIDSQENPLTYHPHLGSVASTNTQGKRFMSNILDGIANAPKTPHNMWLSRYMTFPLEKDIFICNPNANSNTERLVPKINQHIPHLFPISTSMREGFCFKWMINTMHNAKNKTLNGMLRINVPKGTPCIFIGPPPVPYIDDMRKMMTNHYQYEVLLPPCTLKITSISQRELKSVFCSKEDATRNEPIKNNAYNESTIPPYINYLYHGFGGQTRHDTMYRWLIKKAYEMGDSFPLYKCDIVPLRVYAYTLNNKTFLQKMTSSSSLLRKMGFIKNTDDNVIIISVPEVEEVGGPEYICASVLEKLNDRTLFTREQLYPPEKTKMLGAIDDPQLYVDALQKLATTRVHA